MRNTKPRAKLGRAPGRFQPEGTPARFVAFLFQVHSRRNDMLSWALIFFVVAIIAAIFGFGGIATASAGIAQVLFFLFLVLFVVSLIMGLARRG
jgi:uncharacterized membrane protein YtjA (UPF0391 family)